VITIEKTEWRLMISFLLLIFTLPIPTVFGQQNETDIHLGKSIAFHSKILNRDLNISLYLPSDYGTGATRYPVLYDPNDFLFKYDVGTVELLSVMNSIPRTIVVGTPGIQNG